MGHSDGKENLHRGTARGLGEWKRIVNYRQIQLDKLRNVEVHLKSRLTAQEVLDYGAGIVIVATGCHYATDGLNAATHEPIPGADTSLDWQLTHGFYRKVLRATARIPYGQTRSYKQIASTAGSPRAVRATGSALGSNPLPIIVPCHRVLRTGGALGGYGGGLETKQALLELEGALEPGA